MAISIQAVVSLDTRMFTSGIQGIEASINEFAGLAAMQFGGLAQQIAAMWGAFGPAGAAVTALGSVVEAGASMEQQMQRVASYTGMTGEQIDDLRSEAMELAGDFGFSADEIGGSLASLALAGLKTKESLTDVLTPSLMLAKATLGDATQAAEAITSTLNVFQLGMADATHVADMFAGAIASSPLDMQRLTDALKYAGPAAASFGESMEMAVSEIAAFHMVGQRGQMAGTAFRGALMELTEAAAEGKGQVGAALKEWNVASEGLTGAVRRLNDAGVDTADVILEMGKRAGPGLAALMKYGADAMEDLAAKVKENADVQEMFGKQMDTVAGQYDVLKGKLSQLSDALFRQLAPGLRKCVDALQESVDFFAAAGEKMRWMGGIAEEILPFLLKIGGAILGINGAIKMLNKLPFLNVGATSIGGMFSNLATSAGAYQTALKELKGPMDAVAKSGQQMMQKLSAQKAMRDFLQHAGATPKELAKMDKAIQSTTNEIGRLAGKQQEYTKALSDAKHTSDNLAESLGGLQTAVLLIGTAIASYELGSWFAQTEIGTKVVDGLADAIESLFFKEEKATLAAIEHQNALIKQREEAKKLAEQMAEVQRNFGKEQYSWSFQITGVDREFKKAEQSTSEFVQAFLKAKEDVTGAAQRMGDAISTVFGETGSVAGQLKELTESGNVSAETLSELSRRAQEFAKSEAEAKEAVGKHKEELDSLSEAVLKASEDYYRALEQDRQNRARYQMDIDRASEDSENQHWQRKAEIAKGWIAESDKAIAESKKKLEDLQKQLADSNSAILNGLAEIHKAFGDIAFDIDLVRQKGEEWNKGLQDTFQNTSLSLRDSAKAWEIFGDRAGEVEKKMQGFGYTSEQISKHLNWLASDTENIQKHFYAMAEEYDSFEDMFAKYGDKLLDVMRLHKQLGISYDEAYKKLNEVQKDKPVEKMSDSFAELTRNLVGIPVSQIEKLGIALQELAKKVKELPDIPSDKLAWAKGLKDIKVPNIGHVGNMFISNLRTLATEIDKLPTPDANKLSWAENLGKIKVPHLSGVGNMFITNLTNLATAIDKLPTPDPNKLSWVEKLKDIKIPGLGGVTNFINNIEELAKGLRKIQDEYGGDFGMLDQLKDLGKIGDASVQIGWNDNATLSSIASSLETLAGLKGVIWA